ncbi:MAG: GerMN domain-containing protein [Acidaminococcaceae bacterium]
MKWHKLFLAPLLILCFLASGCTAPKQEEKPAAKPMVKEQSFVVYRFAAEGQGYLVPEKHTIKDNGKSPAENALRTLVETKPQDSKLVNVLPVDTKVLGLSIKDGVATADFSKDIKKLSGGSYNELMATGAIVNTLTEFPEIKKVRILVEGKTVVSLNGHMDLTDPLVRDTSLLSSGQKTKSK